MLSSQIKPQEQSLVVEKIVTSNVKSGNVINEKVRYGELRQASFWSLFDILHLLRVNRWKVNYEVTEKFEREKELPYLESITQDELVIAVEEALDEIAPGMEDLKRRALSLTECVNTANNCSELMETWKEMFFFYQEALSFINTTQRETFSEFFCSSTNVHQLINIQPCLSVHQGYINVSFPVQFGENIIEAVQSNVRWLRNEEYRSPTLSEFIIEHIAYVFLASGKHLHSLSFDNQAQFLGTVGFRPVTQTYPSLTDPGDGHVFGTTRKKDWMNGAIIHVEHLERPGGVPRTLIESYRIPSILDFARTRLHTAGAMPNTYFTGRALRDSAGSFQQSFIKVVNTTSAACSQAFSLGAAECKIAMDDLSTSQMIAYLRALSGHTLRSPHQYLSCAFNLNWPIVDDKRQDERGNLLPAQLVTDPFEIAQLAIEIASEGGFDKVTWDGASDTYPSKCIIHQLNFDQWLFLAHRAHECGLTTYTSAGFKFPQIRFGVWAGIDGLGIGGAQILRHMDHESGMHGPYTEENLDKILAARDQAAQHVRGRGVGLLARLDRMFFEGSLTQREDHLRRNLFTILANANEHCIEGIIKHPEMQAIAQLPDDGQRPYVAWAQRLLRHRFTHEEIILQHFATYEEWKCLVDQLTIALGNFAPSLQTSVQPLLAKLATKEMEDDIYDIHVGRIWTQLRLRKAQETTQGHALSRHDNMIKAKTTPFSSNASSRRSSIRSSRSNSAVQSPSMSRRGSSVRLYTLDSSPSFSLTRRDSNSP